MIIDSMKNSKHRKSFDDCYRESTFHQYWIINKKIDSVYGPFQKPELLEKFKELGIPDSLRIE
jgi:hypothetical protein